jgi:hypothetical protein
MNSRATTLLAIAFLCLAPGPSRAQLTPYVQDFESLGQADPGALSGDGWVVFGNVFDPTHTNYLYGYGPFPAPNPGGGFSALVSGQGGAGQGNQQLSVYSDYQNGDHANGNQIESNVYREQTIGAGDVGHTVLFRFDAKHGEWSGGGTTAAAFLKTLDPSAGYATTNFVTTDMTGAPQSWGTYSVMLMIGPGLVGQLLQFGFTNTATLYNPSVVFYDNIQFSPDAPTSSRSESWGRIKTLYRGTR